MGDQYRVSLYRFNSRLIGFLLCAVCSLFLANASKANELERLTLFQFSQVVAKQLDYAIIFSPRVRKNNRIGLVLSEPLKDDSLYNVFLSVLNSHGYAAVKNGSVIRIVREFKARTLPSHASGVH